MRERLAEARSILRNNDLGGFTVPTRGLYPFQWNWDSAFTALGWLTFDEKRCFEEIATLLKGQWRNGMIPHILFHGPDDGYFPGADYWRAGDAVPSSGYSQPPVLASVLNEIRQRNPGRTTDEALARFFPAVMASHRWFWRERNPTGKGLICILHPWESGRDNLPDWDEAMKEVDVSSVGEFERKDVRHVDSDQRPLAGDYARYLALVKIGRETGWDSLKMTERQPFVMIDVLMTAVLLRANRDLSSIAEALGRKPENEEIQGWIETAERNFPFLWNGEAGGFCSYDLKRDRSVPLLNSANFLAFYAGVADPTSASVLCDTFDAWTQKTRYALPSFDPASPLFEAKRYWRGPVWLMINKMIRKGFEEYGLNRRAERLLNDGRELVEKNGFWEYYSPLTGIGLGGASFSWSAAVWMESLLPDSLPGD